MLTQFLACDSVRADTVLIKLSVLSQSDHMGLIITGASYLLNPQTTYHMLCSLPVPSALTIVDSSLRKCGKHKFFTGLEHKRHNTVATMSK